MSTGTTSWTLQFGKKVAYVSNAADRALYDAKAAQRNVLRVDARAGMTADEPGMPAPQRPAAPQ